MDLSALQDECRAGIHHKFLFFWGHQPRNAGVVDQSCLSQWYPAPFEIDGIAYATAEHYMMAAKARLFGDRDNERAILEASHPGEAKKLGRQIRNFDEQIWERAREQIVFEGNLARFTQHSPLREFLLMTGDRVLVEASPVDRIWGIGLAAQDESAADPLQWKGLNLLGFVLMRVRQQLRE